MDADAARTLRYATQMSPNIGWQDLKDLFRAAGNVQRADINMDHTTGQSKGTGVVVMDSKSEAAAAIGMSLCLDPIVPAARGGSSFPLAPCDSHVQRVRVRRWPT